MMNSGISRIVYLLNINIKFWNYKAYVSQLEVCDISRSYGTVKVLYCLWYTESMYVKEYLVSKYIM